ncbi:ATP-binding protein [Sporomusa sp.]|uniref:ATP-binding protein n=1 Tax=Sporomusa sp. TaxID=2078658 RepID=UPI002C144841|nr:ATP-binding protein [Sporomusa sp.]HWR45310.1 ATP-binding protein [Sporomusa sp.]
MAAGIGHEIRNPLTTVKGYLQLFEKKKPFESYREQFNLMIEELDRASGIITEFLSLAKNKLMHQEKCHLSEIVSSITPLIETSAMLESKTVLSELLSTSAIFADPKEIRQLILNLAKNGLESMGARGTVLLKTYDEGGCPILAITDEGCGIPSEMLSKLGTPFMTTKAHGTGLGLPICYSIADRHNAKIEVNSNSNGTEFRIYFQRHV